MVFAITTSVITKKIRDLNQFWVTIERLLLVVVIVIGIFWHFQATWHQTLFGDEIHSLFFFSERSFFSLITRAVEPIHPNGIYVLLKLLHSITPSVFALRIWMFVIFLASCVVAWLIMNHFSLKLHTKLAGLSIWVSSAYLWHFAFQLRMYGPVFLLCLLSFWSLLHKKTWLSLGFDWLLLSFAYGGSLFVVAKWLAFLGLQVIQLKKTKTVTKQLLMNLSFAIGGLLPILLIFTQFLQNHSTINQDFLYWVKTPVFADWSLGLLSLMSGLFLPYFEGFAGLGQAWQIVGSVFGLFCLIGSMFLLLFGYKYRTNLFFWWCRLPWKSRLLCLTWIISLLLYTCLFGWSIIFGSHLFHIRQLFPIAIICWLGLVWLFSRVGQRFTRGMVLVVLLISAFNQLVIAKNTLGLNQAYVHHYTMLPGKPLLASSTEVELIYKQCQTFDRSEAKSRCAENDIYLVDANYTIDPNWIEWWQTSRITNQTSKNDSHSISYTCAYETVDYYHCQQKTE